MAEDGVVQRESSIALRERSVERLQLGFGRYVEAEARARGWDPRDTMINLTPFLDCARRLGVDPIVVLGPIASSGPAWFQETFDHFARRSDVTLAAFGWTLVDTRDGPKYRFE
jgi:hypothetical protein